MKALINYKGYKIHYWGYRGWQVESSKKVFSQIFHTDGEAQRFIDNIINTKK